MSASDEESPCRAIWSSTRRQIVIVCADGERSVLGFAGTIEEARSHLAARCTRCDRRPVALIINEDDPPV